MLKLNELLYSMKRIKQCAVGLAGLLLTSCSEINQRFEYGTINVADAMENLQKLNASQLGSKIKFNSFRNQRQFFCRQSLEPFSNR